MQRQATPAPAPAQAGKPAAAPAAAAAAAAAAAKPAGMSRFLGPMAGLAAGLGIAALLSHFGIGEGMANMLLILALAWCRVLCGALADEQAHTRIRHAVRRGGQSGAGELQSGNCTIRGRKESAPAVRRLARRPPRTFPPISTWKASCARPSSTSCACRRPMIAATWTTSANSPRPKCSPRSRCSIRSAATAAQETDVMQLNAELLEVVTEDESPRRQRALLRPAARRSQRRAGSLREIWHLVKPADGSRGWNVAGIQQV